MSGNVSTLDLKNHGGATTVENYISQINAGGTVYDIATHHGIKFRNGTQDTTGTTWNGITDIEVIIPSITDIVNDPVVFVGTVGSTGTISYATPYTSDTLAKGNLVYITADCTFAKQACEAGDMAIYDGEKWIVISGENQVNILAGGAAAADDNTTTVELSASAKDVLFVEGKELALKLPADLVSSNLKVAKNAANTIDLNTGTKATVGEKYVILTYTAGEDQTIGNNKSINLPTALKSGAVTFAGAGATPLLASDVNRAWTAGTDGSSTSAAVDVTITGNVSLTPGSGSDFVTGFAGDHTKVSFVKDAIKSATFNVADSSTTGASQAVVVSNPTFTNDATKFATGISVKTASDTDAATLFTIPGAVSVGTAEVGATNGVVTNVTLPTLGDSSAQNVSYVDGAAGDLISAIGNPTVTVACSGQSDTSVMSNASVTDHVLSFGKTTISASATQGDATYKKPQYVKSVVNNTPSVSFGAVNTAAGTDYKLESKAVNATFTQGGIKYIGVSIEAADSKAEALTALSGFAKGAYSTSHNIAGNISAGNVVTSVTMPTLPTLGAVSATGTLTGSVNTALDTSAITVGEFASATSTINIGTYAISAVSSKPAGGNYVTVGANGDAPTIGNITIPAATYITDVYADKDLGGSPADGDVVPVLGA